MAGAKWLTLSGVLICALPALAQPPQRALDRCMAIIEPGARLKCYDSTLARPAPQPQLGEAPAPRMPAPAMAKGRPMARPVMPRSASAPARIDGRITAIVPIGEDLFRFQLSDGSVWRTGEQPQIRPVLGETVRIRRTPLTYYATIAGRAAIGVRPIR